MSLVVRDFLMDETVGPKKPSCRLRAFFHDNAGLMAWVTIWSMVQSAITVVQCH